MNNGYNGNGGRQMPRQGQAPGQGQSLNRQNRQMPRQGQAPSPGRPMQGQAPRQSRPAGQRPVGDPRMRQDTRQMPPRNQGGQAGRQYPPQGQRPMQGSQSRSAQGQYRDPRNPSQGQRQAPGRQSRGNSAPPRKKRASSAEMKADRRRRRGEAVQYFFQRLILYVVVLIVMAGLCVGLFAIMFYHTPDKNKSTVTFLECYDNVKTRTIEVDGDIAYQNGILYVNFSNIADACGMSFIYDAETAKFVMPDTEDTSDSAGTGREEYVLFNNGSIECTVCGQESRLIAPASFVNKKIWVPADFVNTYVNGITVTENKEEGEVSVKRDAILDETHKGKNEKYLLLDVSFALKATTAPEPTTPNNVNTGASDMPEVTFSTDLSAYEQYMNPADVSDYLILVNKTNTVDASFKPDDLTNIANTRQDGRATAQMREYAAKALDAMFIEMKAAGFTDVSVTSAYRSYEYQNELYTTYTNNEMANDPDLTREQAQAIVDTYSAKAGTSEHQTGLCCDLHNLPGADVAFANEPAYDWLCENAWKFGFILRFPEDKTDITGYSFEPWHYRFVGRNTAWKIHSAGICLEEYLSNDAEE